MYSTTAAVLMQSAMQKTQAFCSPLQDSLCFKSFLYIIYTWSGHVEMFRLAGVRWQSLSITTEPLIAFHPFRLCNFLHDAQRLMQRVVD